MNHIYDYRKLKAFVFASLIMLSAAAALAQPGSIQGYNFYLRWNRGRVC